MNMRYLLLALLCFLLPLLSGCKDQSLLTNLDQRQATEIQAVLQKHQITSTRKALGKGLFDISVKRRYGNCYSNFRRISITHSFSN